MHELWSAPGTADKLQAHPESARVFLPCGEAPRVGSIFRNPDLTAGDRKQPDEAGAFVLELLVIAIPIIEIIPIFHGK